MDTLKTARQLSEAGLPEEASKLQASLILQTADERFNANAGGLRVEQRDREAQIVSAMQAGFLGVESKLGDVKRELAVLKWAVTLIVGGVVALLLKAFF